MKSASFSNFLQRFAMPPLLVSTILIGFSVPISVALDNILLAIILLGMMFHARPVWLIATQHPVARAAWLLFGMLSLAVFYGATPWFEAVHILGKYIDLAFIPLFMLILSGGAARRRAQYAFLAAMALTLLLSYLVGLGLLAVQPWMQSLSTAFNPAIFHSQITQNNMMAFAAFLAFLNLREATSRAKRLAWGLFAALAGINVLFMVQGRTGYMILLVLLGWAAWSTVQRNTHIWGKFGWKHGLAICLCIFGLVAAVYNFSQPFHDRVVAVVNESKTWQPGISYDRSGRSIAITRRLDFYYNALHIVQQHPLFGVGTGGLAAAFEQEMHREKAERVNNPHNEYLMITVQTGVIGLALLLFLFYTLWRSAPLLDTPFAQDAARGLVLAYMVNCSFNSALLDHGDGLFFAFMTAVLFAGLKVDQNRG